MVSETKHDDVDINTSPVKQMERLGITQLLRTPITQHDAPEKLPSLFLHSHITPEQLHKKFDEAVETEQSPDNGIGLPLLEFNDVQLNVDNLNEAAVQLNADNLNQAVAQATGEEAYKREWKQLEEYAFDNVFHDNQNIQNSQIAAGPLSFRCTR